MTFTIILHDPDVLTESDLNEEQQEYLKTWMEHSAYLIVEFDPIFDRAFVVRKGQATNKSKLKGTP